MDQKPATQVVIFAFMATNFLGYRVGQDQKLDSKAGRNHSFPIVQGSMAGHFPRFALTIRPTRITAAAEPGIHEDRP
jgi:hypothetical protein